MTGWKMLDLFQVIREVRQNQIGDAERANVGANAVGARNIDRHCCDGEERRAGHNNLDEVRLDGRGHLRAVTATNGDYR